MILQCSHRPAALHSTPSVTTAVASHAHRRLPAVRRSLAGLPVHQTQGGSLVVPVLQPGTDKIPFGLALTLQTCDTAPQQIKSLQGKLDDLYELQYVLEGNGQLHARSGMLQNIAAGDSILAPFGKAWCQIPDKASTDELAVLTLLVPGSLPNSPDLPHQEPVDAASEMMHQWQSSPVVDVLVAEQVTELLAGAKKQALKAVDGWRDKQITSQTSTLTSSQEPSSPPQPEVARAESHQQASTSDKQAAAIARNVHGRLPKRAQQLLQVFSQQVLTSARKGPLASVLFPNQCVVRKTLAELSAFQLPNQTNRLALMFDPMDNEVPFTFGVEIFEKGHQTNPHTHAVSHELFFILAGDGVGFCDKERFPVTAGDVVVFPPTSLHGIDNGEGSKMYCLELMLPNDMFAEFVRQGQPAGKLRAEDMCILLAQGCASS